MSGRGGHGTQGLHTRPDPATTIAGAPSECTAGLRVSPRAAPASVARSDGEGLGRLRVFGDMSPWISDLYLRSQTDARLLSLTRDGHGRAFATLAERYRAELLAHARRLSSTGNAEDLLQQTLLSAFAALNRGAEVGHTRGWLHAILRHAAIRARAPVEASLELASQTGEAPDALLDARADVRLVLSALDALPARQREALVGSTVQGLSRAELATTLGVSEGAVRQLVHRARSAVRTAITSLTPYPVVRWLTGPAGSAPAGPPEVMIASGAAGAGGVVAKLGIVAAAGAIAASGLAAGHHGSPRHMHAPRPAPVGSRTATTVAASARAGADPRVTAASAGEFVAVSPGDAPRVTVPARAAGRGGVRATPGDGSGLGPGGSSAHPGRGQSVSGESRDGSRDGSDGSPGAGTTTGRDGGSSGGSGDGSGGGSGNGTSPPLGGEEGSRGSAAIGSPGGSGAPGAESGGATTTTGPSPSVPAATTASDTGAGSGDGGWTNGGGSASAAPGSAAGADGG